MNTAKKVGRRTERSRNELAMDHLSDAEIARARIAYTLACEADDISTSSEIVKDFRSSPIADA